MIRKNCKLKASFLSYFNAYIYVIINLLFGETTIFWRQRYKFNLKPQTFKEKKIINRPKMLYSRASNTIISQSEITARHWRDYCSHQVPSKGTASFHTANSPFAYCLVGFLTRQSYLPILATYFSVSALLPLSVHVVLPVLMQYRLSYLRLNQLQSECKSTTIISVHQIFQRIYCSVSALVAERNAIIQLFRCLLWLVQIVPYRVCR